MKILVLSLAAFANLTVAVAPAFADDDCVTRCYKKYGYTQRGHQCAAAC